MRKIHPIEKLFDAPREPGTAGSSDHARPFGPGVEDILLPAYFVSKVQAPAIVRIQKPRIVGYARRSSRKEGNDSIDRQHRLINEHAMRVFGKPVDGFYDDPSFSGRTWNRPGLKRLMADAEAGEFSTIIVEDVDRVARAMHIITTAVHEFQKRGVVLHSWQKGGAVESSDVAIRGWHSAEQLEILRKRVLEGRDKMIQRGLNWGAAPFGYNRDLSGPPGQIMVDPELRDLIVKAFEARRSGLSLRAIAIMLNNDPKCAAVGATYWKGETVKRMFQNTKYCGINIFGKTSARFDPELGARQVTHVDPSQWVRVNREYTAHWKIVEPELWNEVFATLGSDRVYSKRPATFVTGRVLTCSRCGLTVKWGRRNGVWRVSCRGAKCEDVSCHFSNVEEVVLAAVRKVLEDESIQSAYVEAFEKQRAAMGAELASRRKALQQRFDQIDVYCRKLFRDALMTGLPDDLVAEERAKATAEREAVRHQLSTLPKLPPELDLAQRSNLLEAFDKVMASRNDTADRNPQLDELYQHAFAAISTLIESIKIHRICGSRGFVVETTIRIDPMFHAEAGQMDPFGVRRTFISAAHRKAAYHYIPNAAILSEADEAWNKGMYHATDQQYEAVLPLVSPAAMKSFAAHDIDPRIAVNIMFFIARCNIEAKIGPWLVRESLTAKQKNTVARAIAQNGRDGGWRRMMEMIRIKYPDLFSLMKPKQEWAYFKSIHQKPAKHTA